MQAFLTARLPRITELCRAHHVRRLAVFGSAVREDFDPARSDIDLLVEFEPVESEAYFDIKSGLREGLTGLFARRVDLLAWKSVKNPCLRREIDASHEILYAA